MNGQEASLNSDRLLDTLKIPQFIAIQVAVMNEIAYGMRMETEDDDKEHDVVLE